MVSDMNIEFGDTAADVPDDATTADPWIEPHVSAASAASALLIGMALLMVGNALGGSVVGIRAELEAFNTLATGVIMASYFGGFLAGSRLAIRLLANVGHVRVFAALASLASTVALVQAIAVHPVVWAPTRFVTGMCMAGSYVVAESWLNDIARPETRGRILAAYMVVSMGGVAVGQALLVTASALDVTLFIVASVLISMAILPVCTVHDLCAPDRNAGAHVDPGTGTHRPDRPGQHAVRRCLRRCALRHGCRVRHPNRPHAESDGALPVHPDPGCRGVPVPARASSPIGSPVAVCWQSFRRRPQ